MLHTHNVLEHDGSLSRRDMYFDTTNLFDPATFADFLSYFGNTTVLSVNATADARARHVYDMSKINPEFTVTQTSLSIMVGEIAMMMLVWGSVEEPGANREFFEYFFRKSSGSTLHFSLCILKGCVGNERLPVELGWMPGTTEIGAATAQSLIAAMVSASPNDVPLLF